MKAMFLNKEYSVKWWDGETLPPFFALDTETEVKPMYMVPKLATCQVYAGGEDVYYIPSSRVREFLEKHWNAEIVMHNAAFDIRVLEQHTGLSFLEHYDKEKIWDTAILYRLIHLATAGFVPFKFNLALLSERFLGKKLDKDEDVRLGFDRFIGKEHEIPEDFLTYGALDVIATLQIFNHLKFEIKKTQSKTMLSHCIQAAADYALKRIHENGIGFDLAARDAWIQEKHNRMNILENKLAMYGWQRGVKGVKERYEAAIRLLKLDGKDKDGEYLIPRTESGDISSAKEDLLPFIKYEFISNYIEYMELEKATTFVRDLQSNRIHPKYGVLVNTGRTSCSKPNFQNLPRMGGIREMFKAKPGHTFIITDYSTLELCTLSQVLLDTYGNSVMAEKINAGEDLHKYYAGVLFNKSPESVTKAERQAAKAANFGFPGGLGWKTFIEFSTGYGLTLTKQEALNMKDVWFSAFPEMASYLQGENGGVMTRTGRIRGNTTFCAEKNTPFQGLAADGAKLALFYLIKAGLQVVGFVHDEVISEVPIEKAKEMLVQQEKIMIESMYKVVPDIIITVESQISPFYTK